jgi:hypothetical protein
METKLYNLLWDVVIVLVMKDALVRGRLGERRHIDPW